MKLDFWTWIFNLNVNSKFWTLNLNFQIWIQILNCKFFILILKSNYKKKFETWVLNLNFQCQCLIQVLNSNVKLVLWIQILNPKFECTNVEFKFFSTFDRAWNVFTYENSFLDEEAKTEKYFQKALRSYWDYWEKLEPGLNVTRGTFTGEGGGGYSRSF